MRSLYGIEALDRQMWEVRLKTELVLLVGIRCQELLKDLEERMSLQHVTLLLFSCYDARVFYNPMDCSLPGSSIHGLFQARILEWVPISFSRGIFPTQVSHPCFLRWQVDSLPLSHKGSLIKCVGFWKTNLSCFLWRQEPGKLYQHENVSRFWILLLSTSCSSPQLNLQS